MSRLETKKIQRVSAASSGYEYKFEGIDTQMGWKKPLRLTILIMILVVMSSQHPAKASDGLLKPYKEKLFRYRKPLETADGGNFLKIPYNVLRDINRRDEQPVRKVKSYYVSTRTRRHERDLALNANGRKVTYFGIGALEGNARATVIFLHGRDGSRHLGFNDDRFGGNFNRLKNLLLRNKGLYISADFADFENKGKDDVKAIISRYRSKTSGPLVIACGSMGAFLCWRLAKDPGAAGKIDGMIILGGFPDQPFLSSAVVKSPAKHIPILLAHGSIDSVYNWNHTYAFYKTLRKSGGGYPVRYVLFDTGKHGTPVRMVDWRDALNWIATQ